MDKRTQQLQAALDLHARHLSYRQIAEALGCSAKTAHKRVGQAKALGLVPRNTPTPAKPVAKLAEVPAGNAAVARVAVTDDHVETERARQLAGLDELDQTIDAVAFGEPSMLAWRYARLRLDVYAMRARLLGVHRPPEVEEDANDGAAEELKRRLEQLRQRETG